MKSELDTYNRYLRERVAAIVAALDGLSEDDLNRAPDLPSANSPYVIASHVLGSTRGWVLGIVCGQDLRRDRPAEFVARGTFEQLTAAAGKLSKEIEDALASLDPAMLDERHTPPKELWGESEPYEIMRRDGLAHMLEHGPVAHLGGWAPRAARR